MRCSQLVLVSGDGIHPGQSIDVGDTLDRREASLARLIFHAALSSFFALALPCEPLRSHEWALHLRLICRYADALLGVLGQALGMSNQAA
jgi:hypothetical protein